jgi:uncharacterized protein YuzE
MIALKSALPFLVLDLESALVHIGRGDVVEQLRGAMIERWTYDENADAAYLHLGPPGNEGDSPGETVSVYDELGINLDTDGQGRLIGILIFGGKTIFAQLEAGQAS